MGASHGTPRTWPGRSGLKRWMTLRRSCGPRTGKRSHTLPFAMGSPGCCRAMCTARASPVSALSSTPSCKVGVLAPPLGLPTRSASISYRQLVATAPHRHRGRRKDVAGLQCRAKCEFLQAVQVEVARDRAVGRNRPGGEFALGRTLPGQCLVVGHTQPLGIDDRRNRQTSADNAAHRAADRPGRNRRVAHLVAGSRTQHRKIAGDVAGRPTRTRGVARQRRPVQAGAGVAAGQGEHAGSGLTPHCKLRGRIGDGTIQQVRLTPKAASAGMAIPWSGLFVRAMGGSLPPR